MPAVSLCFLFGAQLFLRTDPPRQLCRAGMHSETGNTRFAFSADCFARDLLYENLLSGELLGMNHV